jgi:hypothetical protein
VHTSHNLYTPLDLVGSVEQSHHEFEDACPEVAILDLMLEH